MSDVNHKSEHVRIGSIVIRCYEWERMLHFWKAALHYDIGHTDDGFVILRDRDGNGPNVSGEAIS